MNSPEGQHIDNFFFATNKSVSWVFSYAAEVLVTATFQGYKKSQNIATVSSTKATMSETTAAHAEVEIEHKRNLNYITTAAHLQATAIANATSEAQCIESRIASSASWRYCISYSTTPGGKGQGIGTRGCHIATTLWISPNEIGYQHSSGWYAIRDVQILIVTSKYSHNTSERNKQTTDFGDKNNSRSEKQ